MLTAILRQFFFSINLSASCFRHQTGVSSCTRRVYAHTAVFSYTALKSFLLFTADMAPLLQFTAPDGRS
ncbi:MAG TPA: hypothetical protein VIK39_17165 [Candidatus Angelobacter sp.]|jgi:hypothetical protein